MVGAWKVFEKAGKPGWAILVPVYNIWVWVDLSGKEPIWFVLALVPFINVVAQFVVNIAIAERFGKDVGYGIGMALLPFVFYPILGFGDARYGQRQGGRAGAVG